MGAPLILAVLLLGFLVARKALRSDPEYVSSKWLTDLARKGEPEQVFRQRLKIPYIQGPSSKRADRFLKPFKGEEDR